MGVITAMPDDGKSNSNIMMRSGHELRVMRYRMIDRIYSILKRRVSNG
jgi:hypothetical protein